MAKETENWKPDSGYGDVSTITGDLLLETGDNLLLEDGFNLELEDTQITPKETSAWTEQVGN